MPPAKRVRFTESGNAASVELSYMTNASKIAQFDTLVQEQRDRTKAVDTDPIQHELKLLKLRLDDTPSHFVVQHKSIRQRIQQLQQQLADIESGESLKAFDKKAEASRKALLLACELTTKQHTSRSTANRRVYVSDNSQGRRQTAKKKHVRGGIDVFDERQAVLDRFSMTLCGEVPPLLIVPSSVCTICGNPMTVMMDGFAIGCEGCGIVREKQVANNASSLSRQSYRSGTRSGSTFGVQHELQQYQLDQFRRAIAYAQAKKTRKLSPETLDRFGNALVEEIMSIPSISTLKPYFDELLGAYKSHGPFTSITNMLERTTPVTGAKLCEFLQSIDNQLMRIAIQKFPKSQREGTVFDDCNSVLAMLTGFNPPQMDPQLIEEIIRMCTIVAPVFHRLSPDKTNYWGGYAYSIVSILALLGQDEFIRLFSLSALANKEDIRKVAFESLGWEFFPLLPKLPTIEYIDDGANVDQEK